MREGRRYSFDVLQGPSVGHWHHKDLDLRELTISWKLIITAVMQNYANPTNPIVIGVHVVDRYRLHWEIIPIFHYKGEDVFHHEIMYYM